MDLGSDGSRAGSGRGFRSRRGLGALGVFVLGTLVVLELNDSPFLPSAHSDSVYYLEAARSLASGEGLSVPITSWASPDSVATLAHFPPGESIAVGGVMRLTGLRPDVAALWVLAVSAGTTLALAFVVVSPVGGWVGGLLSVLLLLAMPPFVRVHTAVWSEPLYLPFLLLTLAWMMFRPDRAVLGGLVGLLSVMIRYLGLANVAALGSWAVIRKAGWARILFAVLPGTLAFVGWWVWTGNQGSAVRTVGEFDVGLGDTLAQLPVALEFWLAPGFPLWISVTLLLGVLAAFIWGPRKLGFPLGVLMGTHLLVTVVSRLLVDQRIPFDARVLLPVLVLATLQVAAALGRRPKWGFLLALLWVLMVGREDLRGIRALHQSGQFYSSAVWITSDLVRWAETYPRALPIYSNEPGMLVFLVGRPAKLLPLKTQDLDAFIASWRERPGAIVVTAPLRPDEWPPGVYQERLPLRAVVADQKSVVFLPAQ